MQDEGQLSRFSICIVFRLPCGILPRGGLAQLGERLLCKQEVSGSSPLISTNMGR